jgi:DNA mismatch repair protein MutS2
VSTGRRVGVRPHRALPVCAREAEAKLVDEVYFFSKKHSLDAGAFESFLRTFMPIVTRDTDKLILLDELEAITELEAALKIISSFIDYIKDSDSYAVIVTHMAREILKYTQVRVDGIEAKGLDEDYNLIVDRTPRMNYFAKSTPELILRMVYEKSDGRLREIYGEMLKKF